MRSNGGDARRTRTLAGIFDDTFTILNQDLFEYAFMALVGAVPACALALVLHSSGPVAQAFVVPVLLLAALYTLTIASEAARRVRDNLQPDAARALITVIPRTPALLRPWMRAWLLLFIALLALSLFGEYVPTLVRNAAALAIGVIALLYALPRSFHPQEVVARTPSIEAEAASARLVRRASARVLACWLILLAPAGLLALLYGLPGLQTVSLACASFAFVGVMPVAGIAMSQMYFDLAAAAPRERTAVMVGSAQAKLLGVRRKTADSRRP